MEKIHCDGCGLAEDVNASEHRIAQVILTDIADPRTWTSNPEYKADLCRVCLAQVLHNYFNLPADGMLEVPAFIEPQSLKVVGEAE